MKHKIKITFALLMAIMVFCCLFLSGCHRCEQHVGVGKCTECGADFFKLLKDHCIKNGDLKSDNYSIVYTTSTSSGEKMYFILSYSKSDDVIDMYMQYDNTDIIISMEEIDGGYSYIFDYTNTSGSEYTMRGTLNASLLSGRTSLSYTYSSASSYLNSLLAQLACNAAKLLVSCADLYFTENDMPIRCANLGFD